MTEFINDKIKIIDYISGLSSDDLKQHYYFDKYTLHILYECGAFNNKNITFLDNLIEAGILEIENDPINGSILLDHLLSVANIKTIMNYILIGLKLNYLCFDRIIKRKDMTFIEKIRLLQLFFDLSESHGLPMHYVNFNSVFYCSENHNIEIVKKYAKWMTDHKIFPNGKTFITSYLIFGTELFDFLAALGARPTERSIDTYIIKNIDLSPEYKSDALNSINKIFPLIKLD